jgi:hypothetical protein
MSSPCLINTTQEFVDEVFGTRQAKDRALSKILVDRIPSNPTLKLVRVMVNEPHHTAEWQRQRKFFMQSVTQYTFTKTMMPMFRAEIKSAFCEFAHAVEKNGTAELSLMIKVWGGGGRTGLI